MGAELYLPVPHNFTPRYYQLPPLAAFDRGYKRIIAVWHRRAGKEKTFLNLMIREMFNRVGTYFYLFPTYAQGEKAIWNGKDKEGFPFLDHFPKQLVDRKREDKMQIFLRNGSLFQIIGTDNYDSIMGSNPIGVVFSEYSLQDPAAWDYIRPMLRENGGWAVFDYTPRGKNHGFALYNMALRNPDTWFVSRLSITDTGVLTEEDMDQERAEGMDEEMIQQEYYVSFEGVMSGSYYGKQLAIAAKEGRVGRVPHDENVGVETWWDIGVSDSTSIWFTQTVGKEVHVIDYIEHSGESLAFYAKEIKNKPYVYLSHNGPHDLEVREFASEGADGRPLTRRASAKKLGIDFKVVPQVGVQDGIDTARAFLARCWFDADKCKRGLEALASYHKDYDEKNKCFRSYPAHDWSSHGADSFRYLAIGHRSTIGKKQAEERNVITMSFEDGGIDSGNGWLGS